MNNIETIILDNGLKIFLYKDERRHSTFFSYITLGGGRAKKFILDGVKYCLKDGFAHILEHYIVEYNNQGNFINKLGELQMSTNAKTSDIYTEYYFQAVENIDIGIETILDAVNNVKFNEKNLNKIKEPIIQEIRNNMDNKFYHLNKMMINNVFGEEDFIDVGGNINDIENASIKEIEALYNACYRPDNQIIVIAGNFNKENVVNIIKNYFKKLDNKKHNVEMIKNNYINSVLKKRDILKFPTPMEYRELAFKINCSKFTNKEKLDLDFYLDCFLKNFFGVTSQFYKGLVKKNIISDVMNCCTKKIDDYFLITIGNYTTNGDILSKKIIDTVKSLNNFNLTIFNLNKKEFIMELILRDENIFKMIVPFITNVVIYDYPYLDTVDDVYNLTYDKYVSIIKNLDFSNYVDLSIIN